MPELATEPVKRQRKATRLDRTKALAATINGQSTVEIATTQGVDRVTVWRYLSSIVPDKQHLETFKQSRADILAVLHGKALNVKAKILDSLSDAVIDATSINERVNLLHAVNVSAGTDYDKERLERGQSTSNLGVLGKVIHEVHQGGIHKKMRPRDTNKSIGNDTTSQSNQSVSVEIDG